VISSYESLAQARARDAKSDDESRGEVRKAASHGMLHSKRRRKPEPRPFTPELALLEDKLQRDAKKNEQELRRALGFVDPPSMAAPLARRRPAGKWYMSESTPTSPASPSSLKSLHSAAKLDIVAPPSLSSPRSPASPTSLKSLRSPPQLSIAGPPSLSLPRSPASPTSLKSLRSAPPLSIAGPSHNAPSHQAAPQRMKVLPESSKVKVPGREFVSRGRAFMLAMRHLEGPGPSPLTAD